MNLHTIEKYAEGFSPLKPTDTVTLASDQMGTYTMRCFPVVEDRDFLGYVWFSDLEDAEPDQKIKDLIRKDSTPSLKGGESIYEVVEVLVTNNMDCIAVTDSETGEYQAMVRAWDVLKVLADSATFLQNGSCIVLEMSALQYSLSHITQICENEDMQVIGVLIDKIDEGSNLIHVHLKVNGHNLERLVSAMKRYDIDVPYYSQSDKEPGVIKERYDSLMKFLDI